MGKTNKNNIIDNINYKDVIIIFSIWYSMIGINFLLSDLFFKDTPLIAGFLQILFITAGRFLVLAILIFYFISFYSLTFKELGFRLKNTRKQLVTAIMLVIVFFFLTLIFINFPLSYQSLSSKFNPLIKIREPVDLVKSFFPLVFIYIIAFIISLSEFFILSKIVFELFNYIFNKYLAVVLAGLFYSILLLEFTPTEIMINLIIGIITLFLYLKSEKSLLSPSLFLAAFYSFAIIYIYGWNYFSF